MGNIGKHIDLAREANAWLGKGFEVAIYAAGGWYEISSLALNDDNFEVTFADTSRDAIFLFETLLAVRAGS